MQQSGAQNCCSICFDILNSSKKITITEQIMDLLKLLIVRINVILQDAIICETCFEKIQSASKFKTLYSKNLRQMSPEMEPETERVNSQNVCELCRDIITQSDCFLLYNSLREIKKLDLMNYLSTELEMKIDYDPKICEQCYKSMVNFCSITNLLCIFDLDKIATNNTETKEQDPPTESLTIHSISSESGNIHIKEDKAAKEDTNDGNKCYVTPEYFQMSNEEPRTMELNDFPKEIVHHSLFGSLWDTQQQSDSSIPKIFKCDFCEYQTKLKRNLKGHMITHRNPSEIQMFKCPYCEHQAKRKGNLIDHILIHKSPHEVKMYKCTECNYQSKYQKGLKRHMLTHTNSSDIAMFECENCQFRTRSKSYMMKHVLIHQKVQLHKCPKCDFQTKQNRYLLSHMLIHKEPGEVKMFKCQDCEYQTKRRSDLRRHNMRVHKNI